MDAMMNKISIDLWNEAVINLVDALLGAVSSNFRMVVLSDGGSDGWLLKFHLEDEDELDREEISDVGSEFEVRYGSAVKYKIEIVIGAGDLPWAEAPSRVVYRRRES
ncbi:MULTISPECIES: hypothetical protein [unclassified Rhizobacter]|uniref:hypothetical protein n=1 Tax=unclassified Rhizobacter TaxID=2640088 RepID=UPI0012FC3AC9|nr:MULTISPECIES: hypothetical protein [unclassified Rhizobacter]